MVMAVGNQEQKNVNRLVYWESREINIMEYEKISFGLSFESMFVPINKVDKKIKITEKTEVENFPELTKQDAIKAVMTTVRTTLDAREKQIRTRLAQINGSSPMNLTKMKAFDIATDDEIENLFDQQEETKKTKGGLSAEDYANLEDDDGSR